MRKMLIILISTVVTAMNINSYGELNESELVKAKVLAKSHITIELSEPINWSLGFNLFKIIHFAEIMFLSEVGRRRLIN